MDSFLNGFRDPRPGGPRLEGHLGDARGLRLERDGLGASSRRGSICDVLV